MSIAPHITVVAALLCAAGRFLVSRRAADDPLGPVWEFPGGKVEAGESLPAALARELAEELGIDASVAEEIDAITHDYPHLRVRLHFLRCPSFKGEPRGLDGQEIAWMTPAQMLAANFPEADARLLARLPALVAAGVFEAD